MSLSGGREGMCVYHSSLEAVRMRSGSKGPGHTVITCPLLSLSSPSSSTLIPGSRFTSIFIHMYDVLGRPSSYEGWVEDAKRGLLGGIRLNGGGIPPKRGLEVFGFVTQRGSYIQVYHGPMPSKGDPISKFTMGPSLLKGI
jgi:hypothetical protein